jgi:hypothetical protein
MSNEVIDISNLESINLDISDINNNSYKSDTFGSGIELLMNDKKTTKSANDNEMSTLENELNELIIDDIPKVNFTSDTKNSNDSNLGIEIKEIHANKEEKTWDGFSKFNDIPMNPDKTVSGPQMTNEEALKEKFNYLRKLEQLEKKGVQLTKRYTMESSLMEMMGEYDLIVSEKEKENSVKFQGNMLSACINGIEFLNNRFDPFDFKLDGWGEQFNENINDYDDIFGELHEKYKSKAKMAPEIKLVFQLGASALMVHMSNTLFKSAMPGMDDIMRQNPDLMQKFNQAAVDTMGKTNPGFSGFMNNVMNPEPEPRNSGPPPPPVETQERKLQSRRRTEETEFINRRPDLNASRDGVDLKNNLSLKSSSILEKPVEKQINIERKRPEMKGPSDISNLLGGLKTKPVTMDIIENTEKEESGSTISISELKELQNEGTFPKKAKRKQKSDKNTISLDI